MSGHEVTVTDPFELPGWLGERDVRWTALSSLDGEHLLTGCLEAAGAAGAQGECLDCDLLACDRAFPEPVLDEHTRTAAHQAWAWGQVLLVEYDGRLTLLVPGAAVTVEPVLEAVRRLAKAVGAPTRRFSVVLRL